MVDEAKSKGTAIHLKRGKVKPLILKHDLQFITHFKRQSQRQATMLTQKHKHKARSRSELPDCKFENPCDFKAKYRNKTKCRWDGKCNQQTTKP
jgi:hypothetical protein